MREDILMKFEMTCYDEMQKMVAKLGPSVTCLKDRVDTWNQIFGFVEAHLEHLKKL